MIRGGISTIHITATSYSPLLRRVLCGNNAAATTTSPLRNNLAVGYPRYLASTAATATATATTHPQSQQYYYEQNDRWHRHHYQGASTADAAGPSSPAKSLFLPLSAVVAVTTGTILSKESGGDSDDKNFLSERWLSMDGNIGSPVVSFCEGRDNQEDGHHPGESPSPSAPRTTTLTTSTPLLDLSSVGVNAKDVDALVQKFLQDPSVNISMVPDAIEAQLYKSTILLTLNAVYTILSKLEGTRLLSHELSLSIDRDHKRGAENLARALLADDDSTTTPGVNDQVLRQVATRLLANPAVNSPWIPDAMEEQIYFACLQVMFRVTKIILSTFKVRICGHDFTIHLSCDDENDNSGGLENAALASAGTATPPSTRRHISTPVDLDLLASIARQAGVDDETNTDLWWRRMFTQSDFVRQLHVSLYGLVLGILDDLFLGHLLVQILSDTIGFDLVPAKYNNNEADANSDADSDDSLSSSSTTTTTAWSASNTNSSDDDDDDDGGGGGGVSVGSFAAASFAAGIGVGVTFMAVLASSSASSSSRQ